MVDRYRLPFSEASRCVLPKDYQVPEKKRKRKPRPKTVPAPRLDSLPDILDLIQRLPDQDYIALAEKILDRIEPDQNEATANDSELRENSEQQISDPDTKGPK